MSLGPLELAMLAAIALLFFGPAKLPQLGKSIGEAIRGFKGAMNDMNNEINRPESEKATEKNTAKTSAEKTSAEKSSSENTASHDATSTASDSEKKQKEKDPVR